MLTGDNPRTARVLASGPGVDVIARLRPEDKLREIVVLKAQAPIAMVGDGTTTRPRWRPPRSASPWAGQRCGA
jgi:Cd2+/Zn2+-exporting ATPase